MSGSGSGDALEAARQIKDPEHERVQGKAKAQASAAPLPKGWPKEEVTEVQPQVSPKKDTNPHHSAFTPTSHLSP